MVRKRPRWLKQPLVLHVDDERRDLVIGQRLVARDDGAARCARRAATSPCDNLVVLDGHDAELHDPAVHRVAQPVVVRQHGEAARAPLLAPRVLDDEPVARVADDRERVALVGVAARRLDDGQSRRDPSAVGVLACRAARRPSLRASARSRRRRRLPSARRECRGRSRARCGSRRRAAASPRRATSPRRGSCGAGGIGSVVHKRSQLAPCFAQPFSAPRSDEPLSSVSSSSAHSS